MMTKAKLAALQEKGQKFLADARAIAEKHTDLSQSEWPAEDVTSYNELMTKATGALAEIKTAKHDLAIIGQASTLAADIGVPDVNEPELPVRGSKAMSLGATVVNSPEFKAMMAPFTHDGAISIPKGAHVNGSPVGVKGLLTGTSRTSGGAFITPDRTDIVEMLGRAPLVLDQLISIRNTTSDVVEFVQETSHTNAAAFVPEATSSAAPTSGAGAGPLVPAVGGGYKPEGSWAFVVVQANVKTLAETAVMTKRALQDVGQLEGLINDELERDLAEVEENQILNGDGTGENLRGILNTSGIQTQAYATDQFSSVRKGLTKLKVVGRVTPSAILLNPADSETIDLTKDTQGRYYYGGPQSLGQKTLWGLPTVESEFMPAGFALAGDFTRAVCWDRGQASVTMTDSHADFFVRNLLAVLAEERMAFGVTRPSAFIKIALA